MLKIPPFVESPITWSHVAEAAKHGHSEGHDVPKGDETSCVLPAERVKDYRSIRDWLHKEANDRYSVSGLFVNSEYRKRKKKWHAKAEPPVVAYAVRFRFENFDDKLLFALRWL